MSMRGNGSNSKDPIKWWLFVFHLCRLFISKDDTLGISHTLCLVAYCTRTVSSVFSEGLGARLRKYLDNWRSGFPAGSVVKIPSANAGVPGLILGSGRCPGQRNGNRLQYSCLWNPQSRGVWQATVHGVAKESDMTLWLKQQQLKHLCNVINSLAVVIK